MRLKIIHRKVEGSSTFLELLLLLYVTSFDLLQVSDLLPVFPKCFDVQHDLNHMRNMRNRSQVVLYLVWQPPCSSLICYYIIYPSIQISEQNNSFFEALLCLILYLKLWIAPHLWITHTNKMQNPCLILSKYIKNQRVKPNLKRNL